MKPDLMDIRDAFFEEVYKIVKSDKNVIFISDDMDALALRQLKEDFPNQYINIGVAEQNMMDVAAGLATGGKKVFVFGICSYITMRAFEQIKFSICSMNLPIVIVGIGAGFSFSFDGPSHHGTSDIAIMRTLPDVVICNPCDAYSAAKSAWFSYKNGKATYVRLDKGVFPNIYDTKRSFEDGFKIINKLKEMNIISTGFMTKKLYEIFKTSSLKENNLGFVDILRLKPINKMFIKKVLMKSKSVITIEENSLVGGLGTIVSEIISDNNLDIKLERIALADEQLFSYGSRDYLLSLNGLDEKSLKNKLGLK